MENFVSDIFAKKDESTGNDQVQRPPVNPTKIKVIGVGGGGGNAVNRMIKAGLSGVEFWLMNTDLQVLEYGQTKNRIQLGSKSTSGLGAGGDPSVGEKAAEEAQQEITEALDGADMVFITAGMGGGTGTGAAPVVDAVIVVPNDKLLQVVDRQVSLTEAFIIVDEVLLRGVQGISDIITVPGLINVDFADVKCVMQASGSALMGIGRGQGEGRAVKAAEIAINSQLLESSINGATGVIVNITGGPDMTLHEISDAANIIHDAVNDDATVIIGTAVNENIQGEIQITVIATGFEMKNQKPEEKTEVKQLSASDFFANTFNNSTTSNTTLSSQPQPARRSSMPDVSPSFTNIEIPDFLKK